MSKISENVSLLMSAGHASAPQATCGLVPTDNSTRSEKPSASLSPAPQASLVPAAKNQHWLKGDDVKKSSSIVPTFCCPD